MQTKQIKRFLAVSLSAALIAAVVPLNTAWAAEDTNSEPLKSVVNGIADSAHPNQVTTQGEEDEIKDGGMTYYDIGLKKGSEEDALLRAAVTKNDNLLNWAQLAYMVYRGNSQSYFSVSDEDTTNHFDGARKDPSIFNDRFGTGGGDTFYVDLIKGLSSESGYYDPTSKKHELRGNDICSKASGLTTARSLKQVRDAMAQSQVDIKPAKVKKEKFIDKNQLDQLSVLNDDTQQPVLYTMVSTRDRYGSTYHYGYNTFALAFYDFKLSVGAGSQCDITTPIDGYANFEEAEKNQEKIEGFHAVNDGELAQYNITNYNASPATEEIKTTTGKEKTVSTTVSNSTSIGYSQGAHVNFAWGKESKFHGEFGLEVGFQQMFESAFSNEKTETEGNTQEHTVTIEIPGHTAATHTAKTTDKDAVLSYDCPMTVTYKVAMVSMCGDYYDDNAATVAFNTSKYQQRAFVTTFGSDVDGTFAGTNLKLRLDNKDNAGYDGSRSTTIGVRRTSGDPKPNWIDGLNWNPILGNGAPQSKDVNIKKKIDKDAKTVTTWLSTHNPMSKTGGSFNSKIHESTANISDPVPMYDLSKIKLADKDQGHLDLNVGDGYCLDNIEVKGYDSENGAFYGFRADKGSWEIVDEDGQKKDSDLVKIKEDKNGRMRMTAEKAGTLELKYFIPENTYKTVDGKCASNSKIKSAAVEVDIAEKPKAAFDGTIEADGEVKAEVGRTINLETLDSLDVSVYDKKGIEIDAPVTWQAKEKASKGIKVENNQLVASKEGTFHIRAFIDDVSSDWITVTASQPKQVKARAEKKDAKPAVEARAPGEYDDTTLGNVTETLCGTLKEKETASKEDPAKEKTKKPEEEKPEKDPAYWAWKNGLLESIGTDVIHEGAPVTREQLMVITYNTAKYLKKDVSTNKDYLSAYKGSEKVSDWAKESVNWAISKGIVSEKSKKDKTLYPQEHVSDQDVSAFLEMCFK